MLLHVAGRQAIYFRYFFNLFTTDNTAISDADVEHYATAYREPDQLRSGFEFYRAMPANEPFNSGGFAGFWNVNHEGQHVSIRLISTADFAAWNRLWQDYLRFYRADLPEETTLTTFERLVAQTDGMLGLVAEDGDQKLVGLAHLIFHTSTWSIGPYCYLEDLFVSPAARGTATATRLITAAYDEADRRGAARTYWHTQEYNSSARSLYDQLAHPTSFRVYER